MEKRYIRNVPALSEDECALLRAKKVCVVGCGGLGGHIIEQLARIGVGEIRCVDGDHFEETNLNRQIFSEEALMGKSKAEAAAKRINAINSSVNVRALCAYLDENNANAIINGCDAVLGGLDNIPTRKILARACAEEGVPYIYGAISGWVAQAGISMPGDGLIDRLYPTDTPLKDKSVLSFTPALCASMQTALCVKLLTGREVESGVLYYYDLLDQEFERIVMLSE